MEYQLVVYGAFVITITHEAHDHISSNPLFIYLFTT